MTDNIPLWSMDSIWSSIESTEYKNSFDEYIAGMDALDGLLSDSTGIENDFNGWMNDFLKLANKTGALEESIAAYAYSVYSTDTTNKKFLDNLSLIEELEIRSENQSLKIEKIFSENKEKLGAFITENPEKAQYRFLFDEILSQASHKMDDAREQLAMEMQRTGGNAWARLQEQLISNLKDTETGKTFNEIRNDAYSADGTVRKNAWKNEIRLLKQNEIAFSACLNNLKGETVTLSKFRSWNTAIDRALSSSRMKKETLDALISAIEESLPSWRLYLQHKALLLKKAGATESGSGTEQNPGIAFYDLFAPLPENQPENGTKQESIMSKIWTFEEAKAYIIERFSSFSRKMGKFAEHAFNSGWIDAKVRSGKVGGAYCQDFPYQKESRVLSNFTGAFSDVITLAHELGHAFHHNCIIHNDYLLSSYPMTLAETASTFAETIVKQDILAKAPLNDRKQILELDLQDTCQTLVDILCRFYFERQVFEERKDGELTAGDFCRIMAESQEKSYGNGLSSERHEYMWAVKSHYYITGLDFYNFPYAFGQLFSAALYARYKKEGKSFVETYCQLLGDTGRMSCEDLCKKAGFDITEKEFWKSGIQMYQEEINQFIR